jgi:CPA1 family monovalent cation:H+ antiporter
MFVGVLNILNGIIRGIVPMLTWSGLRGGIRSRWPSRCRSFPAKHAMLPATYAVVVFSIPVRGLTRRQLLAHYGVRGSSSGHNRAAAQVV